MAREKTFRFKQFNVHNDKSAMKVGTDGVLLGAWADVCNAKSVLDVGTGTGLIALMVAQRSGAEICAVEIDEDAVAEAEINFDESPWNERLNVIQADFIDFAEHCERKFDVIVSNPPYFINSLECPDEKRGKARHTGSLSYEQLIGCSAKLLTEQGHICLITPSDVENLLETIITGNGLFVSRKVYVCPTIGSLPKRILWEISHQSTECETENIVIEKARHVYTDEYIALTHDYYINMP